jgi:hypothetical protein
MDLSVSGVNTSTPTVSAKPSTTVKRADSNGENASNAVASDKVSLDSSSAAKDSPVYADPRTKTSSSSDVAAAVEEANRKAQQITDLIKSAVQQQGLQLSKVVSGEQKSLRRPTTSRRRRQRLPTAVSSVHKKPQSAF